MNRTQRLTAGWLAASGLEADALLREALWRRGFLALADAEGTFLAPGSHPDDARALADLDGLTVVTSAWPGERGAARVRYTTPAPTRAEAVWIATAVLALPEHQVEPRLGGFTQVGPGPYLRPGWDQYRAMRWGAKLAVSPDLDLGVALLVKALPLARAATALSCDGHGERAATIELFSPWDVEWCKAVFDAVPVPTPASRWRWRERTLSIAPTGGFDDAGVLALLDDIQARARSFLDAAVVDRLGAARARVLARFGADAPTAVSFAAAAAHALA